MKATKDMEAAMAGEAQVRRDQEAEREKVKRAITDLRRKLDRWVQLPGAVWCSHCLAGVSSKTGAACILVASEHDIPCLTP